MDTALVDLVDRLDLHVSHSRPPSSVTRPARRGTPGRRRVEALRRSTTLASPPWSGSSSLPPRAASGTRSASCGGPRGEAEHGFPLRLAHVGDRVVRHVERSGCRRARAPRCSGGGRRAPDTDRRSSRVPALGPRPRHRPSRVLAPVALEPDLVAREHHRHAGASSSAVRRRRAGARAIRRRCGTARCRGCRGSPTSGARRTRGRRRGSGASSRRRAVPGKRGIGDREAQELRRELARKVVAAKPGPDRARETRRTPSSRATRPPEGRRGRRARARRRRLHPAERRRAVATTPSATSAFRSRSCRRPVMFATSIRQPSSANGGSSQRATTDDPFP